MRKRGTKQHIHTFNKPKLTPCPTCGAVGSEPCKSQGNGVAMKNHHKGRIV